MATLKELMGDLTRGDGRKFRKRQWSDTFYFEPIFKEIDNLWFGLNQYGMAEDYFEDDYKDWEPYTKPKEKKKVKLYRYILKNMHTNLYCVNHWQSESPGNYHYDFQVVGTEEMEIEVDN